mmetsp:Transcript_10310/g.22956  ORF Transcript_10310/g.22956 Transcript_10310/m.22956 type:complete len:116 (+) Transcript_10310:337-684(+)
MLGVIVKNGAKALASLVRPMFDMSSPIFDRSMKVVMPNLGSDLYEDELLLAFPMKMKSPCFSCENVIPLLSSYQTLIAPSNLSRHCSYKVPPGEYNRSMALFLARPISTASRNKP